MPGSTLVFYIYIYYYYYYYYQSEGEVGPRAASGGPGGGRLLLLSLLFVVPVWPRRFRKGTPRGPRGVLLEEITHQRIESTEWR